MSNIIEIKGLGHWFGKGELRRQILFDVDLSIAPGEIVILTGPSGSGKTTLLTLIGALRAVEGGSLRLFGHELNGASDEDRVAVRRRIGFIFQQHNLLKFLSARQNVEMTLELDSMIDAAERKRRATAMLTKVGLGERLDHVPAKLSGGQKQRVAVARALVGNPDLVLADEPTASLDKVTGHEVASLIERLARERGAPILLVTHDPRILGIADRIVAMEDGRIVEGKERRAAHDRAAAGASALHPDFARTAPERAVVPMRPGLPGTVTGLLRSALKFDIEPK